MITPNTTHQQTQMIVDTVEGIYQNTLTIAQSVTGDNLYGLYSCMVKNSRGSSNRTAFFGYGKTVKVLVIKILYTETFDCYTGHRLLPSNVSTTMWWFSSVANNADIRHQPINEEDKLSSIGGVVSYNIGYIYCKVNSQLQLPG